MPTGQWWVQADGSILGPISSSRLRELTVNHAIKPETLITEDNLNWIPARKVRGLFDKSDQTTDAPPRQTSQTNPPPTTIQRPNPASPSLPQSAPLAGLRLPWPVIRSRSVIWGGWKDLVCIRQDGISFLRTYKPLSEELLAPGVETSSASRWRHIPALEVKLIRVRPIKSLAGSSFSTKKWVRASMFRVESRHGTREFQVVDQECPNVVRALREVFGGRFVETPSHWVSRGDAILIVSGILALLSPLLGFIDPVLAIIGIACALVWGLCVWTVKFRDPSDTSVSSKRKLPDRRETTGRPPFRSPTLGWALKISGLVFILLVLSSERVGLAFEEFKHRKNHSAFDVYVPLLLFSPGLLVIYFGNKLCLRTFEAGSHPDSRPPILFLRAFDDDGELTLQPTGYLAEFHGIFRFLGGTQLWVLHPTKFVKMFFNADRYLIEESLVSAFQKWGPLVAIGRPGEMLAGTGPDRMYVPDANWQEVVMDYLERSQAIVLQPAQTEGIRWEIRTVFGRVTRQKVLLSLLNYVDQPNAYEEFRAWLEGDLGVRLPVSIPFQRGPQFVYFEKDGTPRIQPVCYRSPLIWSFIGSAVDSNRTFRTFIQGLDGSPRESPLLPERHRGHGVLSVLLVGGLILTGIPLLGATLGAIQYHRQVITDITKDNLRTVVPNRPPGAITTYRGRAVPYELSLGEGWDPIPIPPGQAEVEQNFQFREGLGQLVVSAKAGITFIDLNTIGADLRNAVESRARQQDPAANIKLLGSRRIRINDQEWTEVSLEQFYGSTANKATRVLIYSGLDEWASVSVSMPDYTHYQSTIEEILKSLRITESERDRLLRFARAGSPVIYRGKRADYRWSLTQAWRPVDLAGQQAAATRSGAKPEDSDIETQEHGFNFGNGKLLAAELYVKDEKVDLGELRELAEGAVLGHQQLLKNILPEHEVRISLIGHRKLKLGSTDWGEYEIRNSLTKDGATTVFWNIYRITNYQGKMVLISARLERDDRTVRELAVEALDSIRLDN